MRRFYSSIMTEDSAHAAFIRNHAAFIRLVFGVPPGHVPVSDETPLFEPTRLLRPRKRARTKGGRRC